MFVGVDIVKDPATREPDTEVARHIVQRLKEERILLQTDGPHDNVLKFKSPLVFQIDDADRLTVTLKLIPSSYAMDNNFFRLISAVSSILEELSRGGKLGSVVQNGRKSNGKAH